MENPAAEATNGTAAVALCASCDRCRSRKTRCDGNRPCGNCAAKFIKKNKLTSSNIEGINIELFECVYSPAKRRGPIPGKSDKVRKASASVDQHPSNGATSSDMLSMAGAEVLNQRQDEMAILQQRQMLLAQQQAQATQSQDTMGLGLEHGGWLGGGTGDSQGQIQQQLNYIHQLHAQQNPNPAIPSSGGAEMDTIEQPLSQRLRVSATEETPSAPSTPRTVAANLHLLQRDSHDGNRLRAYYQLGIDELFGLPRVPTDEEYCATLNIPGMNPRVLPKSHQSALLAARFAEVALGGLVHNEVVLAMELSNATVLLLKECVLETVKLSYAFEVARAYFLLGCFRAFRGDLARYFKYRRVCMKHLSQLDVVKHTGAELLLAAMSFVDAWAYMIHNGDERKAPSIDDTIPPVQSSNIMVSSETEKEYGVAFGAKGVVCNPNNQTWIQGAPPVFLNNDAPLTARSLDALACAIRTCCDQANSRFSQLASASNGGESVSANQTMDPITPTCSAVTAHEDELCSRNMVLSAFTLLQQHEAGCPVPGRNQGHHLVISAMDAFLENGDDDGSGGFTDSQIQGLLTVCNMTIENPFLLHHGGPTYHIVSNAAILLCHLLNGMYAMKSAEVDGGKKEMETAVFEEVYDTFISVRKLLNIHRRKLPVQLRCHGIPRPSMEQAADGKPFIDLGETLMCGCNGCQGFVLMACSPCVAAERARAANRNREMEASLEAEEEKAEIDKELFALESEFDLDDDDLLNMLSRIIST